MIEKLDNGSYRVRVYYGHERRYTYLCRKEKLTQNEEREKKRLEENWGLPKRITTRRTVCCIHLWQAKIIQKNFKEAARLEARGQKVPSSLLDVELAPDRESYLEELSYQMASICGFKPALLANLEYDLFIAQSSANTDWIYHMNIQEQEIKKLAVGFCTASTRISLKNKTIAFTGAVCGFTGDENYLKCLRKFCMQNKVDYLITAGPWIKTIFLHKSSSKTTIVKSLKDLLKEVKILAIRSNRDKPTHLAALKEIGIEFINMIEDEKNVFVGLTSTKSSSKNQLDRFDNDYTGKNIFFYTSFVGLKTQSLLGDGIRYLVGSGSSGYNTPSSRVWAHSYDTQLMHSKSRDSIGGHLIKFDSDKNPHITTFRYHTEEKALFFGGKAYYKNRSKTGKLHVILSDFHAVSHHKASFTAFIRFLQKYKDKIASFSINGDFLDNMVLCHHNRGKILNQVELAKRDWDFLKEIAYTKECLEMIMENLPEDIRKVFKLGNHEINSINKFLQRDINHFLKSFLDIRVLLGLYEYGFEIIDEKTPYKIAETTVMHGHELQRAQARRILGKNNGHGHYHGVFIDSESMTFGGMQDPKSADFFPHNLISWSTGFSVATEVNGKSTLPQPVLITGNTYADFDELHVIKRVMDVPVPEQITFNYSIEWTGREGV